MTNEKYPDLKDEITAWRKAGAHLPPVMRDFHSQKDIFYAMHKMTGWNEDTSEGYNPARDINTVTGHIYALDCFLWFMARHGYTLQRSRKDLPFSDLKKTVDAYKKERLQQMSEIMRAGKDE